MLLVAVHEVHVEVDPPDVVLVELAVAVLVDPLDLQPEQGALAFVAVRLGVDARLVRIGHHVRFLGVVHPHHRDEAVPVEIVGGILVNRAVAIAVVGSKIAPAIALHIPEESLCRVGVDAWQHVERVLLEEHDRHFVVAGKQPLGDAHRHSAADHVIAVDVGRDQHGGTSVGFDGARPRHTQRPQRSPLAAGADRLHGARAAVLTGETVDRRRELGVRLVAGLGRRGRRDDKQDAPHGRQRCPEVRYSPPFKQHRFSS